MYETVLFNEFSLNVSEMHFNPDIQNEDNKTDEWKKFIFKTALPRENGRLYKCWNEMVNGP